MRKCKYYQVTQGPVPIKSSCCYFQTNPISCQCCCDSNDVSGLKLYRAGEKGRAYNIPTNAKIAAAEEGGGGGSGSGRERAGGGEGGRGKRERGLEITNKQRYVQ